MGAVPSTPRWSSEVRPQDTAEYLIGTFVGEKSFPLASDYWQKLLELPLNLQWPAQRVLQACEVSAIVACLMLAIVLPLDSHHVVRGPFLFGSMCVFLVRGVPPSSYLKAINATYISSVFLKYYIENAKTDNFEELCLFLDENEAVPSNFSRDQNIQNLVMHGVLSFIGKVDVSQHASLLHHELLNFMLVAMSTQLLSGPSPGPKDIHPFIDAAMVQESSLVVLVVHKLLANYITRPRFALNAASYDIFSEGNQPGVLQRVGSAAASFVLLPFSYFVNSSGEATRSPLAYSSLHVLLILIHYRKCVLATVKDRSDDSATSDLLLRESTYFSQNPFCKALENARDIEFDIELILREMHTVVHLCLADETAVLLLYSLVHGNSDFLEYVLVRTDLDTLLMPMLETLYNASKRTSNQIYMVLIILLILSQDSSFNASIHKLILPSVFRGTKNASSIKHLLAP
ncbi:hypothetical protein Acr_03g0018060 [Actinidia rufa]|uniref:Dymeclin n=1 Tax=Actinidia rufa TaxID=165716 RepID=A0A7J0EFA4_9ERIC|nr:hypothetical protein Acr_03g0018060 [Actinidia rufa]